jgi:UDP-glucose 4-epimerase
MKKILVTGSSGFVGRAVVRRLEADGFHVVKAVRAPSGDANEAVFGSLSATTEWAPHLEGCDTVVHLAAQVPGGGTSDRDFIEINELATARLAEESLSAGVKMLVFMSSIFAVAENSHDGPVNDATPARPQLPYGRSKLAAEQQIAAFASPKHTGISLRAPMVYGAKAKGNWRFLQKIAAGPAPLPFSLVDNRRTLVSIDNLADAIARTCHRGRPIDSGTYAVGDMQSVSLPEIIRQLRGGMGRPARLVPVPSSLMIAGMKLAGRGQMAESLFSNLEVDSSRFREVFDWQPPETAQKGIRKSGAGFIGASRDTQMPIIRR